MISAIVTFGMIIVFILSGHLIEGIKRLLTLVIDIILKILNLFGLRLSRSEYRFHMSKEFRNTYKEISIVRKSKENNKLQRSINIPALIVCLISLTLIIINFTCSQVVTNWLWEYNPIPKLLTTSEQVEITFTAIIFSFLSFSISKLISQWKQTKHDRIARKQMRQRRELLHSMSSKELLDTLKEKDNQIYQRLKAGKDD